MERQDQHFGVGEQNGLGPMQRMVGVGGCHPVPCLDRGGKSVVAVSDVEGPVAHGVHQGVGVLADHCPDRLVDALAGGLQDRPACAAHGNDRVQGLVGPVGERDRAGGHPDLEQVAGQQVGPARPD